MSTLPEQPEPLPKFSSNWPPDSIPTAELAPLLKTNGGKWNLLSNGLGIDRKFRFRDFDTCWVSRVSHQLYVSSLEMEVKLIRIGFHEPHSLKM